MTDAADAALLLTNRLTPVDAKPFAAKEFWDLCSRVDDIGGLLGAEVDTLVGTHLLTKDTAERIARLMGAATGFALAREQLEATGIVMLVAPDERYPTRLRQKLGAAAPPVLYVAGAPERLERGGVGVVGSRDVSPEGADVARAVARVAAGAGASTISGAAKGVDQIAMAAALEAEGDVVGVTTEGLRRAARSRDLKTAIHDGHLTAVSPYAPDAGFTAGAAMGRNKIIYGLADVTVVVASAEGSGGTWSGAVEALKHGYGRVAVWAGAGKGPGNDPLVAKGAVPLHDLTDVGELLESSATEDADRSVQLSFGLTPADAHVSVVVADEPGERTPSPFDDLRRQAEEFERERLATMGLTEPTIKSYRRGVKLFIDWLDAKAG